MLISPNITHIFDDPISEYFESGRFEAILRQTEKLIAPYVQNDPTAFCSFEGHQLAVDTLEQVCLLRAQSIRGQLDGKIPATIRGQQENPDAKVDASEIQLTDLGDFSNLEGVKAYFSVTGSPDFKYHNTFGRWHDGAGKQFKPRLFHFVGCRFYFGCHSFCLEIIFDDRYFVHRTRLLSMERAGSITDTVKIHMLNYNRRKFAPGNTVMVFYFPLNFYFFV